VRTRAAVLSRAIGHLVLTAGRRHKPSTPRRVLIAHHLLLGDTLMLTPLIAKLRERYPAAEVVMVAPTAIAPLYEKRPYDVIAWPFDPHQPATVSAMFKQPGFDLAFVPGDNRHAWLAAALGARWIVAHAGDRPAYKNWPVDELVPYPSSPAAWGDMVAALVDGPPPTSYRPSDWPAPSFKPFDLPPKPYAVLHIGTSTPLKQWEPEKWRVVTKALQAQGLTIALSGGKNEGHIVRGVISDASHLNYAEKLDLPQLWALIANAELLVCPDTGVAHLGRATNTPTVALFGPGSALICGAGDFWRASPYRAVTIDDFPCRDQKILFRRELPWVRRCGRGLSECSAPRCMQAIQPDAVLSAVAGLALAASADRQFGWRETRQ
jgi:ADP-heptose:LPS heptosyltransferase